MAPVSKRALDAAGISDPQLRADYETCRRLNRDHGRTYYLSTTLLPPEKRPYVWALYGFARRADEFVDAMAVPDAVALIDWGRTFLDILADKYQMTYLAEAQQFAGFLNLDQPIPDREPSEMEQMLIILEQLNLETAP